MKIKFLILLIFTSFSSILYSQATGKIYATIKQVKKESKDLRKYIEKTASSETYKNRNLYASKVESKTKKFIIVLKKAQKTAITYQRNLKENNKPFYEKLRQPLADLQYLLYRSFDILDQLTIFTNRFKNTKNYNTRKKYYKNIRENYNGFASNLTKAEKKLVDIIKTRSLLIYENEKNH